MISAIVLAAGESTRLAPCKQLLEFDNEPMVGHVVGNVLDSRVDEIIVVLGYRAEEVAKVIPKDGVKIIINPDFEEGMSTSLRAGLEEVSQSSGAVLVVLADQPLVKNNVFNKMIKKYKETDASIVAPVYKGVRGNPVLFDLSLKPEMMEIQGDVGARGILKKYEGEVQRVEVDSPGVILDVNTEEDFQKVKKFLEEGFS